TCHALGRHWKVAAIGVTPAVSKTGVVEIAPDLPVDCRPMAAELCGDGRDRNFGLDQLMDKASLRHCELRVVGSHNLISEVQRLDIYRKTHFEIESTHYSIKTR